ncbi:MAG: 50S ribosomal protein L23 [Armatimonadetes bacterium]|nr:50S ribosomal protein L23 [Armatimonadota bacterium]
MKDPHDIIIRPHMTEKTYALSFGPQNVAEDKVQRTYTFIVAESANKIEIKAAFEAIYNAGKKDKEEMVTVAEVRTVKKLGKMRRVGQRAKGKKPDAKKALIKLAPGQMLEDYTV